MGKYNYLKYKKKNHNMKFLVVSMAIITLSLSLGYSLFFEALRINGSASLAELITDKLEFQLIQTGGRYVTGSFPNNVTYNSESYDGVNNLTINFTRNNTTGATRTSSYNVDFRNIYPNNLTLGSVATTVISGRVTASSSSLTKAALVPNETGSLTVNLTHGNNGGTVEVLNTVQYTYQGVVKYFYFTIIMT
jgi:hypothetical protein